MSAIGDHALLADGRTAALVDGGGEVAWLPWPRIDSDACLLAVLDPVLGGTFSLRPRGEARPLGRRYDAGLVLRSEWEQGRGRLVVEEALAWEGRQGLLRMLRAEAAPVLVEVRFRPSPAFATAPVTVTEAGRRAVAAGGHLVLAVDAPAPWRIEEGVATCVFRVVPGYPAAVVLGDALAGPGLADSPERMAATRRHWRALEAATTPGGAGDRLGAAALGTDLAVRLQLRAGAVLTGLRQRGGGLVAAPTTSLPQWPGSARTWDYRYAWLRDSALAAQALLAIGLTDDAHGVAAFCGDLCLDGALPVLARVDESPPPPERALHHLAGHGGARPVRVGNAAAGQLQLDGAGEVIVLAWAMARARALPESLRRAVPVIATFLAERWREPDHGIWEVRGLPRRYTHSAVMAWTGLRRAAGLARAGVATGDAVAWEAAAVAVRAAALAPAGTGALQLHGSGGGPDGALSRAVLDGFLRRDDPRALATLDAIASALARGGGVDRYAGTIDGIDAPCAPFLFPAFWLAAAEQRCGRDGRARFAAAAAARSALDLMGEVVDPVEATPLGNFPHVQSHAALVLAAAEPVAAPA